MTSQRSLPDFAIVLNEADNVATALVDMPPGPYALADGGEIRPGGPVRAGFKLALRPIARGERIVKYGHTIGRAEADIQPGQCVHVHNMASAV